MENHIGNTPRGAYHSTKGIKVMVMFIFFSMFFIGTVSAVMEWDNVLSYEENDLKVVINNFFNLPILGERIGTSTLKSHITIDEVLQFGFGEEEIVMYYDFKNFTEKYINGLGKVYFTNMSSGEIIEKDYSFVYWGNEIREKDVYESIPIKNINGTISNKNIITGKENYTWEGWLNYNSRDIPNKEIRIGLKTYVGKDDYIDAEWTIVGKRISRHAAWTASLSVGLISVYDCTDISTKLIDIVGGRNGTKIGTPENTTGIFGNGCKYTQADGDAFNITNSAFQTSGTDGTISVWIHVPVVTTNEFLMGKFQEAGTFWISKTSTNNKEVRVAVNTPSEVQLNTNNSALTNNVYWNLIWQWDNVNGHRVYINGVIAATNSVTQVPDFFYIILGGRAAANGAISFGDSTQDEMYFWDRTLSEAEIALVSDGTTFFTAISNPLITLNSPIDVFNSSTQTINFNGTVTSSVGIINVTLFIDGILNETNSSGINDTDYLFTKTISDGDHNWTYESCNSDGCTTAPTRTFTIDTAPIINVFSPTNTTFTTSTIFFNATSSQSVGSWIVNYNGTNVTLLAINTTLEVEDGNNFNAKFYANNSVTGVFGLNDTIFFSVDSNVPVVSVTSPTGDQGTFFSGRNLTLNWTVIDINPHICWYDYEGTNTTVTCADNTTNLTVTDSANISLIFYANDTIGNENSDTTNWSYSFIENNVTFNENASETSLEFFEINLSTSLNVLSISANLNYDGTNYVSTATCGDFCLVNNTIDIPLVSSGESELKNFFWDIDIFNGSSSISITTSTKQQNVSRIHLETCNGTFTTQSLNFTTYNEQNLSRISPYDFEGTFDIWLGAGSVKRNNNFSDPSVIEKTLCIQPNATFFVDAEIQYNEAANVTFVTRDYYFQNDTISNVSQDIFLYLLKSSSSTSFILKVQDDNLLPLEDHIIIIQRFYPGENLFRTVQIAKTSENGKTVGFFETETVDYRFIIKLNGQTLLTTTQQKIVGEVAPFTLIFTIGKDLGKPWKTLENLTNLDFSLIFDKSTNVVTYTYVDTSGNFTLGTLIVQKQNFSFSTNTNLCSLNSSQASATISCNLTGNGTGTYIAKGFNTRGNIETLVSQISFIIETFSSVAGMLGVLLAWFLILISSFAFKFNEIAGIFMVNATVIFVNIIGLVSFGMLAISALVAVSIIIVVVMEK